MAASSLLVVCVFALTPLAGRPLARGLSRRALGQLVPALPALLLWPTALPAADELFDRNRGTNSNALILKDFWYDYAVVPPRKLRMGELPTKQPQFNAFGACVENSCTYVPLKRRYDGYSKYATDVAFGSALFAGLDGPIRRGEWAAISAAVERGSSGSSSKRPTGPVYVALLRAILLANALLISENSADIRDALLARFYVNEAGFAATELQAAAAAADQPRALAAWQLGVDAWQSYFTVVNRGIVPKVGEPFALKL
jgi:hypothetical protein